MKCPLCNSSETKRYGNSVDCLKCGHIGQASSFGAKCTCEQPHFLPVWYCEAHGEVVVPMD